MSKILFIGYHPPQFGTNSKIEAAHYRTGQLLQPLMEDEHEIAFCAIVDRNNGIDPSSLSEIPENLTYHRVAAHRPCWHRDLQKIHDAFRPSCVVAVNFDACLYATRLQIKKPIWMDIYGDYLTIIQAACHRAQSDRGLPTSIGFVRQVLKRGDKFSACSAPQAHALIGELAMAGRLNWRTFGYEFAHVIRPGVMALPKGISTKPRRKILGSIGIGHDDFVVLWCGGYNTWTDIHTLFVALEYVMSKDPRIHFVSLGASTYRAKQTIYDEFQSLIEQSAFAERFHMLGWRPWQEVADYYHESDVGLNIDAEHYETLLGTRTRLVEMMAEGLPTITSLGSELSFLLRQHEAALTFEDGDWEALGQQIHKLARDPEELGRLRHQAREFLVANLSSRTTTRALQQWVHKPECAPDRYARRVKDSFQQWLHRARALVRHTIWRVTALDR